MSDEGTVFVVRFACDNCGKEWADEFHEKVRVWRLDPGAIHTFGGSYIPATPARLIASDARTKPMDESTIECPNCKTYRDVKIVQRIPIEDRQTID
jgi:ribosomal protein L37AE/L43A